MTELNEGGLHRRFRADGRGNDHLRAKKAEFTDPVVEAENPVASSN